MTERKAKARQGKKQIPGGNDRKKGTGNGKGRSRFPRGMTERKAKATAREEADSRGNDRKKGKGNGKGRSRFPGE